MLELIVEHVFKTYHKVGIIYAKFTRNTYSGRDEKILICVNHCFRAYVSFIMLTVLRNYLLSFRNTVFNSMLLKTLYLFDYVKI